MSVARTRDKYGNRWQYHPQSDRHSKVACCGIVLDLMLDCGLLREHVAAGKVAFGINHRIVDFRNDRSKKLDLVLCTPAAGAGSRRATFEDLLDANEIRVPDDARRELRDLPPLEERPVGGVLLALEAKACMTAHQRALPRLYDELNSSHQIVHGASDRAIAAGFVMVNTAAHYLSPNLNKANLPGQPVWSQHKQPRDAGLVLGMVEKIQRRTRTGDVGYDAMSVVWLQCRNDGSPVTLVPSPMRAADSGIYRYESMIKRLSHIYAGRFQHV